MFRYVIETTTTTTTTMTMTMTMTTTTTTTTTKTTSDKMPLIVYVDDDIYGRVLFTVIIIMPKKKPKKKKNTMAVLLILMLLLAVAGTFVFDFSLSILNERETCTVSTTRTSLVDINSVLVMLRGRENDLYAVYKKERIDLYCP
jgi:Kef-type K+ transport system membrane component KefB